MRETVLPEGWIRAKVKDLCDPSSGRTISSNEFMGRKGLYPVYGPPNKGKEIVGYSDTYDHEGECISWIPYGPNAGTTAYIKGRFSSTMFWRVLKAKKEKNGQVDLKFLRHAIGFQAPRYANFTGIHQLTDHVMREIPIVLPPLAEQRQIAWTLNKVEKAIEMTEQAIRRTVEVRDAMIESLLGKGIRHRDFQKTGVGKVPAEWEERELGEIAGINSESRISVNESPDRVFEYFGADSLDTGAGAVTTPVRLLGKDAPARAGRVVHKGDVILYVAELCWRGVALITEESENRICSVDFVVLTPKPGLDPLFLLFALRSTMVNQQCRRMLGGGRYPSIHRNQAAKIKIPFPPEAEQREMGRILASFDERTDGYKRMRDHFKLLGKRLAWDLLTGAKRFDGDL